MNFEYQSTLLERELRTTVEERMAEIVRQLSTGDGVKSFEDYRRLTGYVAAFTEMLGMMDLVRERLTKKEAGRY